MREIKFRVWHADYKKMELPKKQLSEDIDYWDGVKGSVLGIINTYLGYSADKVFMQFTGLLDKNGKEIYEGDIVKCEALFSSKSLKKKEHLAVVTYQLGSFIPKSIGEVYVLNFDNCEVIGNIWEYPQLLK